MSVESEGTEIDEERFGWVVRDHEHQGWVLMTYRWKDRADTLAETDHWLTHYAQVRTVRISTRKRADGEGGWDVRAQSWEVIE